MKIKILTSLVETEWVDEILKVGSESERQKGRRGLENLREGKSESGAWGLENSREIEGGEREREKEMIKKNKRGSSHWEKSNGINEKFRLEENH